jgi:hypothetical protein
VTFVAPLAFALAALAAPIIVLYMLRSRRARTPVSSTMLWDIGQRNVSASAPWQPLRFSWLLFLQLLALLLVVLAVARPARPTSVPLADHTVLIVDTSASMQAGDHGRTRLESAKRAALRAVGQLAPGKLMSVVDAGPRARVVLTGSSDRRSLVEAISSLHATDGSTDASGAFALGQSLEEPDTPTILHFYSDGGVRAEDRAVAPGILAHIPIGSPEGNVGVTRLSVAPRGGGWDAFVRLVNTGTLAADASLVLEADGQRVDVQAVRLDPQAARDVTLTIPRTTATRIVARLENIRAGSDVTGDVAADDIDALSVDDRAYAVLDRGAATRVLLVTPGNVFIESLLKSIPGAVVTTSAKAVPARGYTLVIYDRVDPPAKLDASALVIAAPHGAPGVTVAGSVARPIVSFVQPRDEIVSHVDLSRVAIRSAQKISAPDARTLVAAGDDPLLVVGVPNGRRLAYLGFDLRESNLPVQVAFPLLFGNLTTWLSQGEGPNRATLVAGDPLPLRVPGHADRLVVETPGGGSITRATARAAFDETEHAGFYRVRYFSASDEIGQETFAVNVPSLESSLTPRPITGKLAERGGAMTRLTGLRAFGPGILAFGLLVLLLEWWVAHGRPRRRFAPSRPLPTPKRDKVPT